MGGMMAAAAAAMAAEEAETVLLLLLWLWWLLMLLLVGKLDMGVVLRLRCAFPPDAFLPVPFWPGAGGMTGGKS